MGSHEWTFLVTRNLALECCLSAPAEPPCKVLLEHLKGEAAGLDQAYRTGCPIIFMPACYYFNEQQNFVWGSLLHLIVRLWGEDRRPSLELCQATDIRQNLPNDLSDQIGLGQFPGPRNGLNVSILDPGLKVVRLWLGVYGRLLCGVNVGRASVDPVTSHMWTWDLHLQNLSHFPCGSP